MENAFVGNGFLSALSNSTALKLLLVALVLFVSGAVQVSAEEPHPYKATTADECIQEKECVWDAFTRQIGADNYTSWLIAGKTIHKWGGDIDYSYEGNVTPYKAGLNTALEDLEPFIKADFINSSNPKFFISFTDNMEQTFMAFVPSMVQAIGEPRVIKLYQAIKNGDLACVTVPMIGQNSDDMSTVLSLIDIKSDHSHACVGMSVYQALGLAGYTGGDQPFSAFSDKSSKGIEYSALDKFLLFLFYQPEFKSGQSIKKIEAVFNEIYMRTKNSFRSGDK